MLKYHDIEEASGVGWGLLQGQPFDLDHQRSQELCKNFAWRVTEELAECMDAHQEIHAQEECIDALHFLVELLILVELTPEDFQWERAFDICEPSHPWGVIQELGMAMNCLKQKPWKQTHILTDTNRFMQHIKQAFFAWVGFAKSKGLSAESAFQIYFKKAAVNSFRQNSHY
jgi:hypothetical protein